MIRMDHEKTKSRSGNRPMDLVGLNKMKRARLTSDETARRCENEARWVSWKSAQLSWMECWKLRPVYQFWAVTGPVGWSMMAMGRWALGIGPEAWASSLDLHARASFYTLKHQENQRKRERELDCSIQDQEWCKGSKEAVLWAITRGVENDPLMLAGLLAHSAGSAGSQLNSAGWSVGSSDQCDSSGQLPGRLVGQ
ncbi:hypothetical protein DY000_02017195 [Brassica cretica]|uniref:Uncharacterized protein n=1 Tax=Brassica cretica TaxID=69181 RepID=A0ABQ7CRS0_BRACR|nr:hypothetical protein DY000_02017195 [Brassica cretica]